MQKHEDQQPRTVAIDGIVLAAGRSTRMGESKPSLDAGGTSFIAHAVAMLREGGCREVIAVVTPDDSAAGAAAAHAGARVVMNTAPASEQIDSLRLALRNLNPGARGVLVLPVDHPLGSSASVRTLVDAWLADPRPLARATYQGAPGHPTLFDAALFDELLRGDLPDGARSVVAAHEHESLDVAVDDPAVTSDVDTPDDYRRLFGGGPA